MSGRRISRGKLAVVVAAAALVLLAGVRLWFVEGLLRRVLIEGPSMAPNFCGAHYYVPCGDCGFLFRCDAEHTPSDGKAACPNCGFTDNLLTDARSMPPERVVIDRWPLLFRGPRRGEVVAAHAPGSSHDLAIKRIAAVPGEQLSIRGGDLFVGEEIVRKSPEELRKVRVLVHDNNYQPQKTKQLPARWQPGSETSRWRPVGTSFQYEATTGTFGEDWLLYKHWSCTANASLRGVASVVRDNDSYNQGELHRPLNDVRDLVLSFRLRGGSARWIMLVAIDGGQQFRVIVHESGATLFCDGARLLDESRDFSHLPKNVEIEFGLCDQHVLLVVDRRTVLRHKYQRPARQESDPSAPLADESPLQLAIGGGHARLQINDIKVWRDIYYLDPQRLSRDWHADAPLAAGEYALLGDNQPVSIDGRHWPPDGVMRKSIFGLVRKPN